MFPGYRQGEDLHEQKGYCWGHVKTDDSDATQCTHVSKSRGRCNMLSGILT